MSRSREVASASFGRRNLIINGAMQVAQRGTSATVAATTKYVLDRWIHEFNTSGVSITASQDTTDAPTDKGFGYAIKTVVGTAATSGSSNVADIRQALEGQDCQLLRFGTSDAQDATVSFWVRSSVTGTYCCAMRNVDGDVSQVKEYTISSANTWEYKTLTFSGDTTNALDNDNGASIMMYWDLGTGSTLQTGTTNSWVSGNVRSTANQVNWVGTTGATFYLTGVQLEVGSAATAFEHRPYGVEYDLCRRYFEVVQQNYVGQFKSSSNVQALLRFFKKRRVVQFADITYVGKPLYGNSVNNSTNLSFHPSTTLSPTDESFVVYINSLTGVGFNSNDCIVFSHNYGAAKIEIDVEL